MKKGIFIILALFIPGLFFLNYIGVFTRVKIEEKFMGPFQLVYKEHIGEYKYTGAIIGEVFKTFGTQKNDGKGFGIYLDDPKKTKKENLRSEAGVLLIKDSVGIVAGDLKLKRFPLQKCLVVEYPNKNFLSVYAGIAKVYPKLFKYIEKKGYKKVPVMEIYEEKKIIYVMPLQKQ